MTPPPPAAISCVPAMHAAAATQNVPPATRQAAASSAAYANTFTGDWCGLRTDLARHGISFNGYGVNDNSWNLLGGKSTHNFVSRARLTLGMNLDTGKLFSWPGGTLVSSVRFHFGPNGNDIQLGSLQGFSYIDDAPPATQLYELYYKQTIFNDRLTLQAGRMDVNNIFDIPVDATDFVNPSASDAPLTLQNAPPSQAPGLAVFITAIPQSTVIFGAFFNGRSHPTALDAMLNTLATIEEPDGTSLNIEFDQNYKIAANMPGTVGIGASWRTGKLPTLDGGVQSGTGGGWAFVDQTLWQTTDDTQRVAAWGNGTVNDPRVSEIDYSIQAGLLGAGIIPGRPEDKIAIGLDWAHISTHAGLPKSYEMATECFYECYLGRGMTVQPDLQYFTHTGGGLYPDALIALIRVGVNF